MRNIRLIVAYDGSAFAGWQVQPGQRTVQSSIEAVLERLTQAPCRLRGAGRTDAGVHAEGQVACFHSETRLSCYRLLRGLDSLLPADISIRAVEDVDMSFNPRWDNQGKHYRYLIYRPRERDIRLYPRAWHVCGSLDLQRMARAAGKLVGRHDFAAFRASDCERKTTTRTLYRVTVSTRPPLVQLDVEGTAFLKNMVRIIAGTLVYVGRGRIDLADIDELLRGGERKNAGITAPAAGLTLQQVFLPR